VHTITSASQRKIRPPRLTPHRRSDWVPSFNLGRILAVTEALFGQMYLVTVIALLVGKFSRTPR